MATALREVFELEGICLQSLQQVTPAQLYWKKISKQKTKSVLLDG